MCAATDLSRFKKRSLVVRVTRQGNPPTNPDKLNSYLMSQRQSSKQYRREDFTLLFD
jgi:hypothetical protein